MMTKAVKDWIDLLNLEPHPEGGWFRETYRADESIDKKHLPVRFSGDRAFSTAIYFLLEGQDFSAFHRIKQDEVWHFYDGNPLVLHVIDDEEKYHRFKLGLNPQNDQQPQIVMRAGWLFAAEVNDKKSYTLAGCTVAPGFDFSDFEMPGRNDLLQRYPQYQTIIRKLSR